MLNQAMWREDCDVELVRHLAVNGDLNTNIVRAIAPSGTGKRQLIRALALYGDLAASGKQPTNYMSFRCFRCLE
jgi:hypothetical protein